MAATERFGPSSPSHDIEHGPVTRCQICGSADLELVMDLGHQPLCDSLLSAEQLNEPEMTYPLRQLRCTVCSLGQIDYVVAPEAVFHPAYPYRTGVTNELVEYLGGMADGLIKRYDLGRDSLVIDIGSNDGTLLAGFKRRGMRVLGVEPTNIAEIAREAGIDTVQEFFTEAVATQVLEQHGAASLIVSTNTFAHVASLGEVIRGVQRLLTDRGVFVTENHNLLDIVTTGQFDTIYHEHLRSYSLKSLVHLYSYYDFTVAHAERASRYGGNLRVHAIKGKGIAVDGSVGELLSEEERAGLYDAPLYTRFRERSEEAKNRLIEFAIEAKDAGQAFVGNSCPGRSVTLLNYAGMTPDLMPYITEQPTSLKLNLYLPGKHIPVIDNRRLIEDQPEYVVLLAWHLAEPIMQQLRARGLRSKFVVPLPDFHVIET